MIFSSKSKQTKEALKGPDPLLFEVKRKLSLTSVKLDQAQSVHISVFVSRVNAICFPVPVGKCHLSVFIIQFALSVVVCAQLHQFYKTQYFMLQCSAVSQRPQFLWHDWHQALF